MSEKVHRFVCDGCGKLRQSTISDKAAIDKYERRFKRPFVRGEVKEVCSECHLQIMLGLKRL